MPNWCITNATVTTDSEKTAKTVYDKLNEWLKEPEGKSMSDFGDGWLGNLAVNSGVLDSYDEIDKGADAMAVRGSVDDIQLDGTDVKLSMCTAWGPMMEPLYRAIEKNFGFDAIDITYASMEPGMVLFITNDESLVDKYFVEIDENADESIKKAFDIEDGYYEDTYDEDDLAYNLRTLFGIDDESVSIDELLDRVSELDGIYIYLWEYEDIENAF